MLSDADLTFKVSSGSISAKARGDKRILAAGTKETSGLGKLQFDRRKPAEEPVTRLTFNFLRTYAGKLRNQVSRRYLCVKTMIYCLNRVSLRKSCFF